MTITNLTAKENNGVVVAEFESGDMKVSIQIGLDTIIDHFMKPTIDLLMASEYMEEVRKKVEFTVLNNLHSSVHAFINFNLQEAE